jgi:hypothetical protein
MFFYIFLTRWILRHPSHSKRYKYIHTRKIVNCLIYTTWFIYSSAKNFCSLMSPLDSTDCWRSRFLPLISSSNYFYCWNKKIEQLRHAISCWKSERPTATRCRGSASLWCGSGSCFLFWCRSGSYLSLWCRTVSGSYLSIRCGSGFYH